MIEVLATESMTWERTTVTVGGREPVPPSRGSADSRHGGGKAQYRDRRKAIKAARGSVLLA